MTGGPWETASVDSGPGVRVPTPEGSMLLQNEPGHSAGRSRVKSMLTTFMLCSPGQVSPPLWASGSYLCIGTMTLSGSNMCT